MSTATLRCALGDLSILSGSLRLPALGPWYAGIEVRAPAPDAVLTGAATVVFTGEDGTEYLFVGTVLQAELDPGALTMAIVVVGGAGKLDLPLVARDHADAAAEIQAGLIARGICDDAGEALEDGVEAALDARTVPRWTRFAGTAREALELLTALLGWTWRITPAGKVWIGVVAWPAGASAPRVGFGLGDGAVVVAPDGAPALPGTTVTAVGKASIEVRAVEVLYQIMPGKLRASLRAAVPGDPPRVASLERYRGTFAARVVSQDAAGLLELVADEPALGTLRAVPLRCGIPGARVTLASPAGERLRIAFEESDPRGAYATPAHNQAAASAVVRGVARRLDPVACSSITGKVTVEGVDYDVTFTTTPPVLQGGAPVTGLTADVGGIIAIASNEVFLRWP